MLISAQAFATNDTTRVLFIGNSFVYTYDVPGLFKSLADAAGEHVTYAQHTPGGMTVGDIAQGNQAHMNNPVVFNLIRQGHWDYVVLQDNQGRFVYNYGLFPSSSKVIEGHEKIRDSVHYYNPCAHMLWFSGWAFKAGYPPYGNNGDEMIDRIHANYLFLNDTLPEIVLPIGAAWKRAEVQIPSIDLYGPDGAHQSLAGSYIAASVIYSTIFKKNGEQLSPTGGLDSISAHTYRKLAYETVYDSIGITNLSAFTPTLNLTGNMLTAGTGYTSYQWLKDTMVIGSTAANTFPVTGNGCYQTIGTTTNGCTERSMQVCDGITNVPEPGKDAFAAVYPNPAKDILHVDLQSGNSKAQITIANMAGQILYTQDATGSIAVDLSSFPAGTYIMKISSPYGMLHKKISKY